MLERSWDNLRQDSFRSLIIILWTGTGAVGGREEEEGRRREGRKDGRRESLLPHHHSQAAVPFILYHHPPLPSLTLHATHAQRASMSWLFQKTSHSTIPLPLHLPAAPCLPACPLHTPSTPSGTGTRRAGAFQNSSMDETDWTGQTAWLRHAFIATAWAGTGLLPATYWPCPLEKILENMKTLT